MKHGDQTPRPRLVLVRCNDGRCPTPAEHHKDTARVACGYPPMTMSGGRRNPRTML
jgi:hypothetical protein